MLRSIRSSLLTTVVAITPFVLAACDDNPTPDPKDSLKLLLLPLLFFTVSLASAQLRRRAQPRVQTIA